MNTDLDWMNGMTFEQIRDSHAEWSRNSERIPLKCRSLREAFTYDGYHKKFSWLSFLHFLFPIFRERNEAVCIRLQQLYWYKRLRHLELKQELPFLRFFPINIYYYLRLAYLIMVSNYWKAYLQSHFNSQVSPFADIGSGIQLSGNSNLQISALIRIGKNYRMGANNTIVSNDRGWPIIGDNVWLGSHSVVIGKVKIGDNVTIGAGAVVTKDIPSNSTAVGVPAKIIKLKGQSVSKPEYEPCL